MEPLSIVSISGIGLYALYQFIVFIRNGGRSNCAIGHQAQQVSEAQTAQTEILQKISANIEAIEGKIAAMEQDIASLRSDLDKVKNYTVKEDRNIQQKVDSLEHRIRQVESLDVEAE